MKTIVDAIRAGALDAELGALLWLLAEGAVPLHVAGADGGRAAELADAVRSLARQPSTVSSGPGDALEDVLRQPLPLRPATGAVLIVREGRIVAAHLQRPPLRDAGGHVRPQGPAVLATWDPEAGEWEHFAWGVTPELAAATGQRAGDFEIEQGRRRDYLESLAASPLRELDDVARALRGYGVQSAPS